ncbi:hypothetical protein ACFR9U_14095 [Halorientalis brevis]|uniref:Uncharacterized protein n=1 Tax=Halorientalis brevis TaxID=1126241 RepID=A0ABD6CDI9_9EURY|nr:hypothetical protein [Halorientalis brevis]
MTVPAAASGPPNETDHGVSNETFHTLWAGDRDEYVSDEMLTANRSALAALANGTDIPLDRPPGAVAQWNRGDHDEFPATGRTAAVHPPHASLTDGRFIRDAGATIFAVTPSTRARLSAAEQPLYVAPNGTVRGTVDYRVSVPATTGQPGDRVSWQLLHHSITDTRLLVNGSVVASGEGSRTPALAYAHLPGHVDNRRRLTLAADVEATLERTAETCDEWDNDTCTDIERNVTVVTESVTVNDTVTVVPYDLAVSGFRARYPNGDLGLVVYKNQPWLGHSLPGGWVRGVWRFYAARDARWDTLRRYTANGQSQRASPLQPLQVHAYPFEPGPTPSQRDTITLLASYGVTTTPPTLPEHVNLDVLNESYAATYGLASRTETTDHNLSTVVATGLVRGVTAQAQPADFDDLAINRTNLTLRVVNRSEQRRTVEATLVDAATGAPIDTRGREGYLVIAGERVNTSADGTVRVVVPASTDAVSARYEPGAWWRNTPGYTAASDVVAIGTGDLAWLRLLYQFLVPVGMFLLGVYFIDRITGWRIWPPWRGV